MHCPLHIQAAIAARVECYLLLKYLPLTQLIASRIDLASCLKVGTDNAASMKAAFEMSSEETTSLNDEDNVDLEDGDLLAKEWTPLHFTFDGWLGCSAHQIHLVVQNGYKELLGYRRVQAAFSECKTIASLSQRSSHFAYVLPLKVPVPCDTRWNSHFRLHEHILQHHENINSAQMSAAVDRKDLVMSTADLNSLAGLLK